MELTIQAFLALLPILMAAILLVVFRWPARTTMPIIYVLAVGIALFFWKVSFINVAAATVQGLFITFDILYIIFILLLYVSRGVSLDEKISTNSSEYTLK